MSVREAPASAVRASSSRSSLTCADRRSEVQRQAVVALAIMSRQPGRPLNGRLDATPAPAPTSPQGQQRGGSCWRTRAVASLAAVASDWSDASTARQAADVLVNAGVWSRGEVGGSGSGSAETERTFTITIQVASQCAARWKGWNGAPQSKGSCKQVGTALVTAGPMISKLCSEILFVQYSTNS